MRPDDSVATALGLLNEALRVLAAAESGCQDQRTRTIVADAAESVGTARGNLAMTLDELRAMTP